MDTRHLQAALAVREEGTFTAAAERLFLAQSTLSRQVSALERQIGVELFLRGPRRATTTPAGEKFLVEAEAVLAAVDRAERAVRVAQPGSQQARRRGRTPTADARPRRGAQ